MYRVPLYPWLPGLYLVGIVTLLVLRAIFEWEKSLIDLAFIASGLPLKIYTVLENDGEDVYRNMVRGSELEGLVDQYVNEWCFFDIPGIDGYPCLSDMRRRSATL